VPQLVVPFAHDQPDNARRLSRLGVASLLWPAHATGERMAKKLATLMRSTSVAQRCRTIATSIRPGIEDACDALERYAGERTDAAHRGDAV
jgi:UDP:flavonoid glycosyltransferase YjiC (YdhE family)